MLKNALKIVQKIMAVFVISVFAGVFFASCGKVEDTSYAVSGYVYDELGNAVKDVEIKSELGSVFTDENGWYEITDVSSSLILQPSIEGYTFSEKSKTILSAADDASFIAYKNYMVSGEVVNNDLAVKFAEIEIESLSGTFYTLTDEDGKFYGKNVAGSASIKCVVDGYNFYPVTASIVSPEVKVSVTTSLTLKLDFDTNEVVDFDDISVYVNDVKQNVISKQVVIDGVKCNSVVRLESDKYVFDNSMFVVDSLNQVEEIEVHKLYNVSGTVKSGEVGLGGAEIYLNGHYSTIASADGTFVVSDIVGKSTITAIYPGLNFNMISVDATKDGERFDVVGTKTVSIYGTFDIVNAGSVNVLGTESSLSQTGEVYIQNAQLGDTIELFSEKYYLTRQSFVVSSENKYTFKAYALYDASVEISGINGAQIVLDEENVEKKDLKNLYGTHTLTAVYENYKFGSVTVNYYNKDVVLEYKVPYSVLISTYSGDIYTLDEAKAQVGEEVYYARLDDGVIEIPELFDSNDILVIADGFDAKLVSVSSAASLNVELTYTISGVCLTEGGYGIANAKVFADEAETTSDENGNFSFVGLKGNLSVFAESDAYHNFSGATSVSKGKNDVKLYTKFNISGTLTDKDKNPFEGYEIRLYDDTNNNLIDSVTSDEFGKYKFENLSASYYLLVFNGDSFSGLSPRLYNVSVGGVYDFSLGGFSISGYVTSGEGNAVTYAYVTAGATSTITDSNGYYEFKLLTEACSVSVQKTGYEFLQIIEVSDNKSDVNFDGTYTVTGVTKATDIIVSNVKVLVNGIELGYSNEKGEFTISGISGKEVVISFEKERFDFSESSKEVSAPTSLQVSCNIFVNIKLVSGGIGVLGFEVLEGENVIGTTEGYEVVVSASYGAIVTARKTGYVAEEIKVVEPKTIEIEATYSIFGSVMSGDVPVLGVKVSSGDKVAITDSFGNFTISGLSGNVDFDYECDGFVFVGGKNISGYTDALNVQASYSFSGIILLGDNASVNVKISLGDKVTYSDSNGNFAFTGIYGRYNLIFEKDGYTFSDVSNKFGSAFITVESYFKVVGRVVSGNGEDNGIFGAVVQAVTANSSVLKSVQTNANGEFVLEGLSGSVTIIASKNGYTSSQVGPFSDYVSGIQANLTYSVTLKFDTDNVTITQNKVKVFQTNVLKEITISGLVGTNEFVFEKVHTKFTPASVTVSNPDVSLSEIKTTLAYNITGSVVTEGGLAVGGVTVFAGNANTKTDENGNYSFTGVAGSVYVKEGPYTSGSVTIGDDKAYSFTISNKDFANMMIYNGYKKLDDSSSVQIYGNGIAHPSMGGDQTISSVFKRDSKGNIIKENKNLGKEVAGIDPTVAFMAAYVDGVYKTQKTTNVSSDGNGVYDSLSVQNADYFKQNYGSYIYEYGPYVVSASSITGASVSVSGDSYVISITLSNTSQGNYVKQIEGLSPGSTFNGFTSIVHTYTISKSGWIIGYTTSEKYSITQTGIPIIGKATVTLESTLVYTFVTNAYDIVIPDIDVSSLDKIYASLA